MDDSEQLSPELALVDPELAERARASLPEEPWLAFARPPRRRLRSRALVPVFREPAPGRERRRPVAAVLAAAAVIAVFVVLAFGLLPSPGPRPSFEPVVAPSRAAQPPAPAAAARTSPARPATPARSRSARPPSPARPPSAPPPAARQRSVPPPAAEPAPPPAPRQPPSPPPAPPPAARQSPTPPPAPQPAAPKPPPPARPPPPAASSGGFQPARVFAWAPVPGATYYHVVFLLGGKRFYEGFPAGPRITLPRTVRFVPGTYTWTVRPGTGPRAAGSEGAPIVDSTFTIEG